jgi:DNA gyrase subunit A
MGMAIRFPESDVRPMGMVAAGVLGIKLAQGDEVIGMLLIPHPGDLLFVSQDGMGKRVKWDQFPSQGRYGQGVIAWKLPGSVRLVAMLAGIPSTKISLLFEHHTPKTIRFDKVALLGRTAKGQSIIDLPIRERIVRISQAQTAAQGMQDVPAKGRRRTSRTGDTAQPTVPARQRRVTTPKSEPNTQATQIRLPEPATTPPAKSTSRSSKSSTLESTSPTTADKKPGTRSTTRQSSQNPEPSVKPSKPKGTVNKEPVSKTTAPKSDAKQNIDQGAPGRKRGRPPKKQNP